MKQKTSCSCFLATLAIALVLTSCTKTGQIGLQGAQGPQGNPGSTGPQGPPGDTGTANVIYSKWDSSFSGTSAVWPIPEITQGVLDSSVVLIFVKQNGFVYQIPISNLNGSGFYIIDLMGVGYIYIYCDANDNLKDFAFRYVIIPGGVAANFIHKSYQEIFTQFNLTP
jgi:hypothetical protein